MKINKKLHLVIPVKMGDDKTVYVHSTPISPETFDNYVLLVAKTFTAIIAEGLGATAGPRVAAHMLKIVAHNMGGNNEEARKASWEDAKGLVNEIQRSTNMMTWNENGWETVPYQEVIDKKLLDVEDIAEVNNAITFFTVAYAMFHRGQRQEMLEQAAKLWGSRIELLNCTDFMSSLRTSTVIDNSVEKATVSSVPR